ncbi:MAG: hypothetical protein ABSH14_14860, partial [Verrucomicrobiia bacterium]
ALFQEGGDESREVRFFHPTAVGACSEAPVSPRAGASQGPSVTRPLRYQPHAEAGGGSSGGDIPSPWDDKEERSGGLFTES